MAPKSSFPHFFAAMVRMAVRLMPDFRTESNTVTTRPKDAALSPWMKTFAPTSEERKADQPCGKGVQTGFLLVPENFTFLRHGDDRRGLGGIRLGRKSRRKVHVHTLVLNHGQGNHHEGGKQEEHDVDERDDLDAGFAPGKGGGEAHINRICRRISSIWVPVSSNSCRVLSNWELR